jgi:hypothetical protein
MLDFPELFAPARMVSGRISIDCRCAIDLYPQTLIPVKPSKFGKAFLILNAGLRFISAHLDRILYRGNPNKTEVYNAASTRDRKNCARTSQGGTGTPACAQG